MKAFTIFLLVAAAVWPASAGPPAAAESVQAEPAAASRAEVADRSGDESFFSGGFSEDGDLLADDSADVDGARPEAGIADPIEGFNRAIFAFNDGFYRYVLQPVARGYDKLVPEPVARAIGNFFHNLLFPSRVINYLLQGDWESARLETERFFVDTFRGFGGFLRPSREDPDLETEPVDLGLTLGTYGLDHGFYLVLPVFGPTSLRDGIGTAGEILLSPVYYLPEWEYRAIARGLEWINASPALMDSYHAVEEAAIDPYLSLRNAYVQRRERGLQKRSRPAEADTEERY